MSQQVTHKIQPLLWWVQLSVKGLIVFVVVFIIIIIITTTTTTAPLKYIPE